MDVRGYYQTRWMAYQSAKILNEDPQPRYDPGPDILPPDLHDVTPVRHVVERLADDDPRRDEFEYRVVAYRDRAGV